MMTKSLFMLLLLIQLASFGQASDTDNSLQNSLKKFNIKMIMMMHQISKPKIGNFLLSPFSLHQHLTQMMSGAPEFSETFNELSKLLELQLETIWETYDNYSRMNRDLEVKIWNGNNTMNIANRMFVGIDTCLVESYQVHLRLFFTTNVEKIDFSNGVESEDSIDNFVAKETAGLIETIVDKESIGQDTKLALLNALHFRGEWKFKFDPMETGYQKFCLNREEICSTVTAMRVIGDFESAVFPEIGTKVLKLPFEDDDLFMLIFLPEFGGQNYFQIKPIEDIFTYILDREYLFTNETVEVILPKFEIEVEVSRLSDILQFLGAKSIFNSRQSELSLISNEILFIENAIHKVAIKVSEDGVESAASTFATASAPASVPLPPAASATAPATATAPTTATAPDSEDAIKLFHVNSLFVIQIVYKNGNVPLFTGIIGDPNSK